MHLRSAHYSVWRVLLMAYPDTRGTLRHQVWINCCRINFSICSTLNGLSYNSLTGCDACTRIVCSCLLFSLRQSLSSFRKEQRSLLRKADASRILPDRSQIVFELLEELYAKHVPPIAGSYSNTRIKSQVWNMIIKRIILDHWSNISDIWWDSPTNVQLYPVQRCWTGRKVCISRPWKWFAFSDLQRLLWNITSCTQASAHLCFRLQWTATAP